MKVNDKSRRNTLNIYYGFTIVLFGILFSCNHNFPQHYYSADNPLIKTAGRIDKDSAGHVILIGSASSLEFKYVGDSCKVVFRKTNIADESNYVTITVDGKFLKRVAIDSVSPKIYTIYSLEEKSEHSVGIYKATEANTGQIIIEGIYAEELYPESDQKMRKIEFIGNSITCNMGGNDSEIPCGKGSWFDQHDAYFGYGPSVSRVLNAEFVISAVSGIGIYRNWNSDGPTMPEIYNKLYLNEASNQPYVFSGFIPDLVSIALGTNDFSIGDGVTKRLPYNEAEFVTSYINFVQQLRTQYPSAVFALLTSPMMAGEARARLYEALRKVKEDLTEKGIIVHIFQFPEMTANGCSGHPNNDDQLKIAAYLEPFYREIMDW